MGCIGLFALVGVALPGAGISASLHRGSGTSQALASELRTGTQPCSRNPSHSRYVSNTGSDGGPGTRRRPWRTITAALNRAVPGEAIYLRSGTYPEWATAARDGTARRPITLSAYPGEHPVLTGRLKIEGAFFCVRGLRFEGKTSANKSSVLIYVSGAHHVEILKNQILNAAQSGIFVGDEGDLSEDLSIIRNVFRGNGTDDRLDHGIYLGHVQDGLVADNLVTQNRAIGIKVEPEADDILVTQNTVVANGKDGIVVGGELNWSSNNNLVVNNIVAFNHAWGIRTYWEHSVGGGNRALRNLVFDNGDGAFWFPGGGMSQQLSILRDPRFVSAADYQPRAGSPALNRAIPTFSMRFDINGRTRSQSHADLGAFER